MPGRGSRDKRGRPPKPPVLPTAGGFQSDARASDDGSDRKARAPLRGAIGTRQSCRQLRPIQFAAMRLIAGGRGGLRAMMRSIFSKKFTDFRRRPRVRGRIALSLQPTLSQAAAEAADVLTERLPQFASRSFCLNRRSRWLIFMSSTKGSVATNSFLLRFRWHKLVERFRNYDHTYVGLTLGSRLGRWYYCLPPGADE